MIFASIFSQFGLSLGTQVGAMLATFSAQDATKTQQKSIKNYSQRSRQPKMRLGPVKVRSGPRLWFSQTSILAPDLDLSPQTSTFERFGSITSLHCYIVTLLLCYFATLLPCCWRGGGIAALLRIGLTKSNKSKSTRQYELGSDSCLSSHHPHNQDPNRGCTSKSP